MSEPGRRDPDEPVDPEIVEESRPKEDPPRRRTFFEPASGLVVLGVDWLAFGVELPAGLFILPGLLVCALAFAVAFWSVYRIQRGAGDGPATARMKALIGGIAAGVPFPVTGTVIGAGILVLSGLDISKKK